MAETLQSTGIILPDDLLPDDTELVYENGIPRYELPKGDDFSHDDDYDGPLRHVGLPGHDEDSREYHRCIDLGLAYYNDKNVANLCSKKQSFVNKISCETHSQFALQLQQMDYRIVEDCMLCLHKRFGGTISTTHCGFFAAPMGCETAVKYFCSELLRAKRDDNAPVTSCSTV